MTDKRKYADRAQYLIKAVSKRRRRVREMAINYLGGRCQICGYNKCQSALDFHHRNEIKKHFGISERGYSRSWDAIKKELEICYLLCANCHREVHTGTLQLPVERQVEKQGKLREAFAAKR